MTILCKDCRWYKEYGFSTICKYCKSDGNCPECGTKMRMGNSLDGPCWICPEGHAFTVYGMRWKG